MGIHDGHRNRLRQRFLDEGLDNFQPHNVLELILFYCIPRKDTNEIAHRLIQKFGTIHGVFDAPVEELCRVPGITYNGAVLIKSFLPVARYYTKSKGDNNYLLDTPDICGHFAEDLFRGMTNERTVLICMDNRCKLLSTVTIAEGDISSVGVSPRKIMETVLATGATGVIIAHNHPGGVALPSPSDIVATRNIAAVLSGIGVRLLDHIIVVSNDHVSLAQSAEFADIFTL